MWRISLAFLLSMVIYLAEHMQWTWTGMQPGRRRNYGRAKVGSPAEINLRCRRQMKHSEAYLQTLGRFLYDVKKEDVRCNHSGRTRPLLNVKKYPPPPTNACGAWFYFAINRQIIWERYDDVFVGVYMVRFSANSKNWGEILNEKF